LPPEVFQDSDVNTTCTHLDQIKTHSKRTEGCEECEALGQGWVHLRLCLTCGHVGCCDDSEGKHATAHFKASDHALMKSIEPGESWGWCFVDKVMFQRL